MSGSFDAVFCYTAGTDAVFIKLPEALMKMTMLVSLTAGIRAMRAVCAAAGALVSRRRHA
ncbi:hypothetical protein [Treponema endosymbiont of Eucomonympha sp.]|uniref:hypothetical protein n=1 Tax=Treponema endosymbiont of Eucomonympha sp. TaxID=1580831 RepID=UPI000785F530|nr:hypothetical protein [Treponema endosymbiont of Eucomonympha sp.]